MLYRISSFSCHFRLRPSVSLRKFSTKGCGIKGEVLRPRCSVNQAISHWTQRFEIAGVPEPDLSSHYIISHALGFKTFHQLKKKDLSQLLSPAQMDSIEKLCTKRLARMPVQYVIEEWDFRDITLKMKPPVFIPRPETEELVGLVLADLEDQAAQGRDLAKMRFLEIGCGSGAICLSLLHSLPQMTGLAVDQSAEAVALTRLNAHRLGLSDRLQIEQLNVMKDVGRLLNCGPVELLVSNPPYLFTEDLAVLETEILRYEDRAALDGGESGMNVIHQLLSLAPRLLSEHGRVYLEVDARHPAAIQSQLQQTQRGLEFIQTHLDFTNRPRFCILQRQ